MKKLCFSCFIIFILSFEILYAQKEADRNTLSVEYQGGDGFLTLSMLDFGIDSLSINLIKKSKIGEEILLRNKKIDAQKIWHYLDTSIRKTPGIYAYEVEILNQGFTIKEEAWLHAFAKDQLSVVDDITVKTIGDSGRVLLTWHISDPSLVQQIILKRSRKKDVDFQTIGNLKPSETSFVDLVSDANESYFYRVDLQIIGKEEWLESASVPILPSFKIIPEAVENLQIVQRDSLVTLYWESSDIQASQFFVEKRKNNTGSFERASVAISKDSTNHYQWKDQTSILKTGDMYQYRVFASSNSFDLSPSSDTVSISFQESIKFLNAPQELDIIHSNNRYFLIWNMDSIQLRNITGFLVYKKSKRQETYELIQEDLIPVFSNSLEIPKPTDGDSFKIVSVNAGIRSADSPIFEFSNVHENNFGPKYLKATVLPEGLWIKWLLDPALSIKQFKLYGWENEQFVLLDTIEGEHDSILTKKYEAGAMNLYKITAINSEGIESLDSEILEVN